MRRKRDPQQPQYHRIAEFTGDKMLDIIAMISGDWEDFMFFRDINGVSVRVKIGCNKRYRNFANTLKCVSCVRVGNVLALERQTLGFSSAHFNLYARDSFGKETMMTADHIVPVAKGGHNGPSNIQMMCSKCNGKKRDLTPWPMVVLFPPFQGFQGPV